MSGTATSQPGKGTGAIQAPPPGDSATQAALNTSEALVALYMLADYQRVSSSNGGPPQPGWFARHGVFTGINGSNRGVVARAITSGICTYCGGQTPANSTGDHILSLEAGGPADLENYVPCCRSCNSSKGKKDLLDWWYSKQRSTTLSPDLLVAYCRLSFRDAVRLRKTASPANETLVRAVRELAALLPTVEHRRAAWQRVVGVVGKRWEP